MSAVAKARTQETYPGATVIVGLLALVAALACQGTVTPTPQDAATERSIDDQLAGNWQLVRIETFDENDQLIPPSPPTPASDGRLGYLMYDPAGYMSVVILSGDRQPYAEGGPTADEARAALGTYISYFGRYTLDEAQGTITHHVLGSHYPNWTGADNVREYQIEGDQLMLKPPRAESGVQSRLTWQRVPDAELSPEQRKFVGFWRIRGVERRTATGDSLPTDQYADGYITYTASGHMAVHLLRPDRPTYQSSPPSDDEVLAALRGYYSYFGPFTVNGAEQAVTHARMGATNPTAGRPTPFLRNYEFGDNTLTLSPPPRTVDGQEVRSYLTWERLR